MPSYSNGGVIVDAEEPLAGATLDAKIGSITSVDIQTNTETIEDDSGGIYDEASAVTQISPTAAIGSRAIAEVLSVIGVTGQCFNDASGDPGVIVYGKNRGDCLTDVESDDHSSYTFANGLMTLQTLQASKGSDAEISFLIEAIYDGTNVPLVISHAATLPSTLVREQFEIGLCALGGSQFKPESVTINFGQRTEKPRGLAPSIYPERIAVSKVQPMIELEGLDPSFVTAITAGSATHANTKIQLVKRLSGSSYVSAGTAEHIAFTAYGTIIKGTPFRASGQGDASTSLTLKCLYDGTNAPILFNNAVAYDTSPES